MNNKEKFKKELEKINPPEELITKTKNRIENQEYENRRKYIWPSFALVCTLVISLVIGKNYLTNNNDKYFENNKMIENKEYSSLFLKKIDKDITEEDTKKIILTVNNEDINIDNPELYQTTMEYIEKFTGESRNMGVTSNAYFNKEGLKSYYGLYEKDLILVTINDKYIIRIPYKEHSAITIIDLTKEKFTHYTIYPDENNDSYKYLNELREYIMNEFNLEKEVQEEKQKEIENTTAPEEPLNEVQPTEQSPDESNNIPQENKPVPKTYGDVNQDGSINSVDVSIIRQHVAGMRGLSGYREIKAADVNGDGEITGLDATLLQYAVVKAIKFDGYSPIKSVTLYGDVSESGQIEQYDYELLNQYINGEATLSQRQLLCADINNDGEINKTDLLLLEGVINGYINLDMIKPLTNYILYGDVDLNGVINSRDASVLNQYMDGKRILDGQQLKNADVNADGMIGRNDAKLIQEFMVQMHENTLPFKPIK